MNSKLGSLKNIAVVGAGFIGVELSDELSKRGFNVVLIEKLPHILNLAFDCELSNRIHEMLESRNVKVKLVPEFVKSSETGKLKKLNLKMVK
jgi:NADH oxidase (H2O2-forming)